MNHKDKNQLRVELMEVKASSCNPILLMAPGLRFETSARFSANPWRGRKSLYAYPMGRHNLDLFADPQRRIRSLHWLSLVAMTAVCIKRNPSGSRVFASAQNFAVASYDGQRSERNKDTKEKQPARVVQQNSLEF
jgi:hypothetical protein